MIDIENYSRAIAWLRSAMDEFERQPANNQIQLGLWHCFEVTHNISEGLLREAYIALDVDEIALHVSLRELIHRAAEEGMRLSTPAHWLQYATILESTKQAWMESAKVDLSGILPILPRYVEELEAFAKSLRHRMAPLA